MIVGLLMQKKTLRIYNRGFLPLFFFFFFGGGGG